MGVDTGAGGGAITALIFFVNICERAAYPPVDSVLVGAVAVEDGPEFWYWFDRAT